ncbi:MAG: MFS transporter, partial [Spirochaetota bacterium]
GAVVASIVFGDEKIFTILGGALILSLIFSNLLTPFVLKFVTKKQLMIYSNILSALFYIIMFFVGYSNFILFLIFIFISGFFSGFFIVVLTAMIADSVDYYEYKTDTRNDGISFAGLTFISKLMGALATMAFGAVIVAIGYSSNSPITPKIKDGVFFSVTLLPAISCIIGTIPLIFYPLTDDKIKQISKELDEKRNTIR